MLESNTRGQSVLIVKEVAQQKRAREAQKQSEAQAEQMIPEFKARLVV